MSEDGVMRVQEVARRLGVHTGSVYNLVASGALPAVRVGRLLRITERQLDEFLSGSGTRRQ